jgi:hypothetical protein
MYYILRTSTTIIKKKTSSETEEGKIRLAFIISNELVYSEFFSVRKIHSNYSSFIKKTQLKNVLLNNI